MGKRPAGRAAAEPPAIRRVAEPPAVRRGAEPPAEQAEDDEDMPGLRGPYDTDDDIPAPHFYKVDGMERASESRA